MLGGRVQTQLLLKTSIPLAWMRTISVVDNANHMDLVAKVLSATGYLIHDKMQVSTIVTVFPSS